MLYYKLKKVFILVWILIINESPWDKMITIWIIYFDSITYLACKMLNYTYSVVHSQLRTELVDLSKFVPLSGVDVGGLWGPKPLNSRGWRDAFTTKIVPFVGDAMAA